MGHFTHNCKLTGIPIKDNAVLIVMRPNPTFEYIKDGLKKYGSSYMCSNDSTRLKFLPVWFPIHGKYDEYGGLENIVKDDNTEILEKYYDLTIEEIVNIVTSNRKDDGYDDNLKVIKKPTVYPKGMKKDESHFQFYQRIMNDPAPFDGRYPQSPNKSFMVFRNGQFVNATKEEYDSDIELLQKHYARYNKWKETNPDTTDDYDKPQYQERYLKLLTYSGMWVHGDVYQRLTNIPNTDEYNKLDLGTPELLNYLGFKEVGKSKDDRFNRIFEKDGLKIHSDGTWIEVKNEWIGTLKDFKKYCEKNGVTVDISDLDCLGRVGQTYKLLINSYKLSKEQYFRSDEDRTIQYYFLNGTYNQYNEGNVFTKLYIEAAQNGKLYDNLIRFWSFDKYMYSMGVFYDIVGTGPQDGEFRDVKDVLQIALDITNEFINEYYNEDDED